MTPASISHEAAAQPWDLPADLTWRDASHDHRREMIVATALRILHEQDMSAVTMRGVAAQLGVGTMTLYTYVSGQDELRRAMIRRGFDLLGDGCCAASTLATEGNWRGSARAYIQFARQWPNLYMLMFADPVTQGDGDVLATGFAPLLEIVADRLKERGYSGEQLGHEARRRAGRYWIGLHGLASIVITNRAVVLEGSLDDVLDDLLEHVKPV
jgi:AcrR family transcriptional regulator